MLNLNSNIIEGGVDIPETLNSLNLMKSKKSVIKKAGFVNKKDWLAAYKVAYKELQPDGKSASHQ